MTCNVYTGDVERENKIGGFKWKRMKMMSIKKSEMVH